MENAPSHGVAKRAGGVNDDTSIDRKLLPRQLVTAQRAPHTVIGILRHSVLGQPVAAKEERVQGRPAFVRETTDTWLATAAPAIAAVVASATLTRASFICPS